MWSIPHWHLKTFKNGEWFIPRTWKYFIQQCYYVKIKIHDAQ